MPLLLKAVRRCAQFHNETKFPEKMRLLLVLIMLSGVAGHGQDLIQIPLTKTEMSQNYKAHYYWQSTDGHYATINLWLSKNGSYEYQLASNLHYTFSEGSWKKLNGILMLTSNLQKNNLPINVSFRQRDSTDFNVKKIAFIKDLNGKYIANAFVYVNDDSTACMDGDLLCRKEFDSIKRIRIEYENYGISSQWIDIPPFNGLLQITIETTKELGNFSVFENKKYLFLGNMLKPLNP
jgi:hypothetical protein